MVHRAGLLFLFITALVGIPLAASQPQVIAGRFLVVTTTEADLVCLPYDFKAYLYFGPQQLAPTETLTVTLAIIPFQIGPTVITFDAANGPTFAGIMFA